MRRWALLALLALSAPTLAQIAGNGPPGGYLFPYEAPTPPTNGQCPVYSSSLGYYQPASCSGGSSYNPAAVAITGGTISGVTISGSTITLWTIGTGASSTGCAATSVNIGAASNAATGQGGGSLLSGTSGICAVVFTLPAVGHYWDCTAHDVTLQVNFVMTATSATGCTISYPTQSGDLVTLNFQGS